MIVLFEPPRRPGFVSGGYRYHDEIMRRLAAQGRGRLCAVAPHELAAAVAGARAAGHTAVVDGLYASLGARVPAGAIALLHMVPARDDWAEAPVDVIATAATTADAVRGSPLARRVAIVRPGLDECFWPRREPPQNARFRVVCVGTVCAAKGQWLVAEALARIAARQPCELVLLGDLTSEPNYVLAVARAAAPLRLRCEGVQPPERVADELRAADLFVSASRAESYGMAVAEAVACGVPVVGFATGEVATFVRHGENGWLIAPSADDAALRERLAAPATLPSPLATVVRRPDATWDATAAAFTTAAGAP